MIEVEGLAVELSGRRVVSDVSFHAEPGRLTAIIGPNGSGKTTTLRAISGERRFAGKIRFNGSDLMTLSAKELALSRGVLAQSVSLGFPFRVREILEMGIIAGDCHDRNEAEALIASSLAAVDMQGFESRVATALSGGEQARMHMARVLCQIPQTIRHGKPSWLLLDEPVASLDIRHQLAIMKLAKAFAARGGGVIAVMHDLNLTAMFADHIIMMREGKLHGAGSPTEVLTEPTLEAVYGCPLSVARDSTSGMIRVHAQLATA